VGGKVVLLILLTLIMCAQSPSAELKSACEERAQKVLRTLESNNSLRYALERGNRGDCIHQPWMDNMQRLGIKQASFLIEYSWKHGKVSFKIKSVTYFQRYYPDSDEYVIKGRRLHEIERSGLAQELSDAVLARVRKGPFAIHHPDQVDTDEFQANVLDDESLPVIDRIF
jgi:hypothetical protein